jgi:capsular exopolysaccharide synthesis family protein
MSRILNALRQSTDEIMPEAVPAMPEATVNSDAPLNGLGTVSAVHPVVSPESRLEALTHPNEFAAEQFRMLGSRLQHLADTRSIKSLLVTSPSFREGKSLVSLNLAITLARRGGKKVLLVEGDLRKPALCQMLGLPPQPGLSDWIQSNQPLTNFLCRISDLDLWLLPAGESCEQPLAAIESQRMREFPTQAAEFFDWTLIDSTPLLVADASVLSRLVDGTMIVVRQESTQKKPLQKSLASLERVLGFVLNDATSIDPRDYNQYYMPTKSNGNGNGHKRPIIMSAKPVAPNGANTVAS